MPLVGGLIAVLPMPKLALVAYSAILLVVVAVVTGAAKYALYAFAKLPEPVNAAIVPQ